MKKILELAISDTTERFQKLIDKEIQGELLWRQLSRHVCSTLDLGRSVISIYIKQCEEVRLEVESLSHIDQGDYTFYHKRVDDLNKYLAYYRGRFLSLFSQNFDGQLILYLFLEDLIAIFPPSMDYLRKDVHFFFEPMKYIATWALHKELTVQALPWMEDNLKVKLNNLQQRDTRGLGAVHEESIVSQIILAHEIFHVILAKNDSVKDNLNEIAHQVSTITLFNKDDYQVLENWIEEFFCDYGASFLFGPIFGREFAKELVYTTGHSTDTHPPRKWRISFILDMLRNIKNPFVTKIRNYYKSIEYEQIDINIDQVRAISDKFQIILLQLGLKRYTYSNKRKEIYERNFENKIPYEYKKDIRDLLNNLPKDENLSLQGRKDINLMVVESIRKNTLKREFEETMEKMAIDESLIGKG